MVGKHKRICYLAFYNELLTLAPDHYALINNLQLCMDR